VRFVVGMPFSGTLYCSKFLTGCGFDARHEVMFFHTDRGPDAFGDEFKGERVEVSNFALGYSPAIRERTSGPVIRLVREPLRVFRAILSARGHRPWVDWVKGRLGGDWGNVPGSDSVTPSPLDVVRFMEEWNSRAKELEAQEHATEAMTSVALALGCDRLRVVEEFKGVHAKPRRFDYITLDNLEASFGPEVSDSISKQTEEWGKIYARRAIERTLLQMSQNFR